MFDEYNIILCKTFVKRFENISNKYYWYNMFLTLNNYIYNYNYIEHEKNYTFNIKRT